MTKMWALMWAVWASVLQGAVGAPLATEIIRVDTSPQLQELIAERPLLLIHFLDFSEAHSKTYAQTFESVLGLIGDAYAPLPVATVGAQRKEITEEYRVTRFPTILMAVNGHLVSFQGVPDSDSIQEWLVTILGRSNLRFADTEDQLEDVKYHEVAGVIVVPPNDQTQVRELVALAAAFPEIPFYVTSLTSPVAHLPLKYPFTLILHRSFEPDPRIFGHEEPLPYARLRHFVQLFRFPLVRRMSSKVIKDVFRDKEAGLFLFFDSRKNQTDLVLHQLVSHAGLKIRIYSCDVAVSAASDALQLFGSRHRDRQFAGILTFAEKDMPKYLTLRTDLEGLLTFFKGFEAGTIKRYYKSEDPFKSTDRPLRPVAAKELESLLLSEKPHLLLFIYFRGSSHESPLMKQVRKLRDNLLDENSLTIGLMNAVENEHPLILADAVPAIFLFKGSDKGVPLRHHGPWSAKDIIQFVEDTVDERLWTGRGSEAEDSL